MERKRLLPLLLFLILLASCRDTQGTLIGPGTGAGGSGGPPLGAPGNAPEKREPVNVSIAEILTNPATHEGRFLRVSGQFQFKQPISCEGEIFGPPDTWVLGDGELELPAAGPFDSMPSLPAGEEGLTVDGQWQRWRGLTGCGDHALPAESWYLEVSEIVFPNSSALIPALGAGVAGPRLDDDEQATAEVGGAIPAATAEQSGAAPTMVPTASNPTGQLPPALPTQSAYPGAVATPLLTPAATRTTIPTATATPGGGFSTMPILTLGSLEAGQLLANEVHRWPFEITATKAIRVQIAPEPGLDVGLSLHDPSGQILAEDETDLSGQPLILENVTLPEAGTYEIIVSSSPISSGDYTILIGDNQSYDFVFHGFLTDGDIINGQIDAESDHFWHFMGESGEEVDISATPTGGEDLFLRLFGPDGSILVEYYDENPAGVPEQLFEFNLPASGIYSVLVGESNFGQAGYLIQLSMR